MSEALQAIKAGDRVWVGKRGFGESVEKSKLIKVFKVTKTQIVLDWNGSGSFFRRYRKDGYPIGAGMMPECITGIAGADECARWEAKQEAIRLDAQRRQDAEDAIRQKAQELTGLLGAESGCVRRSDWYGSKTPEDCWKLSLDLLTEEQVRRVVYLLAPVLKELVEVKGE